MDSQRFHLHDSKHGAAISMRVTPKASRNEIVEIIRDGIIKIHITAPPVDGKANDALIKFLSEVLDIAKSRIDIIAGVSGRDKLVTVLDMDADTVHKRIMEHLG